MAGWTTLCSFGDLLEINNCNCRNKNSCPLEGNCNVRNIIYQAEVVTPQSRESYIGLCDTTFKERYRNHTCSFRNERYKNVTELSKHIWNLKDRKINYELKWRKVKQARSYSNFNKRCNLCLCEKYFIICKPEMSTLNHRNELTSTCRHSKRFLLNTVFTLYRFPDRLALLPSNKISTCHASKHCSLFFKFVYLYM